MAETASAQGVQAQARTLEKIRVDGVSKSFSAPDGSRTLALDNTDLVVRDQEIVCLLGPSGCGKSTLLNIIAGFEMPTAGSVTVNGQTAKRPGPDRAMVFQTSALFPWLTVWRNITLGCACRGMSEAEYSPRAAEFISIMGLESFENHYPYQLSGGMRQRVSIARALLGHPEVLLLDEPFGALDAQTRLTMQELLLGLYEKYRPTIVFVTHDVEEAIFLASRIIVMSARPGRVREEITVPLGWPRTYDVLTSGAFVATKKRLLQLVHHQ